MSSLSPASADVAGEEGCQGASTKKAPEPLTTPFPPRGRWLRIPHGRCSDFNRCGTVPGFHRSFPAHREVSPQ